MLTDLQKDYLKKSWTKFHETLTKEQQDTLHFLLDDLLQYGLQALPTIYFHLNNLRKEQKHDS